MKDAVAGFDWDAGNLEKCRKHGVSIKEIEAILNSNPAIAPDIKHSANEDQLIAVGKNNVGRAIFVAFTIRKKGGRQYLRPVSARYMRTKEAERYEKKSP